MKKRVSRIVGWALLCVLIFTACGAPSANEQQAVSKAVSSNITQPVSASKPKEIVMETLYASPDWLDHAAKKFEEKTGVKVRIKNRFEDIKIESAEIPWENGTVEVPILPYSDVSQYTERTINALLTSEGADIYEVQFLDYVNLGKNGLLCDLAEKIKQDPNLAEDKIFNQILLSAQVKEGLYAIPVYFWYSVLCSSSETQPQLEDKRITWQEFFNEVQTLPLNGIAYAGSELEIFINRFSSRSGDFINEDE